MLKKISALSKFVIPIIMLALSGCNQANVNQQSKENNLSMEQLFDFKRYASKEEAQAAFDKAFPIGSDATSLLAFAEKHFSTKNVRKVRDTYFLEPKNVDSYLFGKTYEISPETQNLWVLGLMIDQNNKIVASGIQLYFEDQNFAKRGINFHFENFSSKSKVKNALDSILRATMYQEDIINLMQSSGAKLEAINKTDYGKFLRFVYTPTKEEYLRNIKSRTWATPLKFEVVFKFDQADQFNDVFVYGDY